MKLPNLTPVQDSQLQVGMDEYDHWDETDTKRRRLYESVYEDNIRLMETCKSLLCYTTPVDANGSEAIRQASILMCVIGERPPKELVIRKPK